MDEFKPSKIDKTRLAALYNHFRDSYDGHEGVRGRADQTQVSYTLLAPLVVAGEESPDESAIRERGMELLFSKRDLKDQTARAAFAKLSGSRDDLMALGRAMLDTALKLMRISELRALAQKCTVAYGGERVSHTRNVASLEDAVMKIMEAEKELDAQIDLLVDTKKEIAGVIELVPDVDCRLLLEMRYLAMKCWIDVAAEMNVCRAYVHRLHEKALDMVETILQERSADSHE